MASDDQKAKRRAHELIDRLAPNQASAVVDLLEAILDPVSRAIANARLDDETVSPSGEKALNESREWAKHHRPIPHAQVIAELGITHDELDRFLKQT